MLAVSSRGSYGFKCVSYELQIYLYKYRVEMVKQIWKFLLK